MKRKSLLAVTALGVAVAGNNGVASGAQFLSASDFIIGIDRDAAASHSSYPLGELPSFAHDNVNTTKYLNFGINKTGIIITPFGGATTAQSIQLTTANDAEERDPLNWQLYGTNDTITSTDNSAGTNENWTLIDQQNALLPAARNTTAPVQAFTTTNTTAYKSYRVVFPTVKNTDNANSMQIGEVRLFSDAAGTSANIFNELDTSYAIQLPVPDSRSYSYERAKEILDGTGPRNDLPSDSGYPGGENPSFVVDGTNAKYLNFAGANSGFIVTPAAGSKTIKSFALTTANDAADRDPTSYSLFGTNDPISSLDNSLGIAENWTPISSGAIALPADRNTLGATINVTNNTAYTSYKMLFPTVNGSNLMQIAEAQFFDATNTDFLNPGDVVKAIDADTKTGLDTKYLNFGGVNSGFIVSPAAGAKALSQFRITTGNDAVERDPASYEIYGTNDTIVSTADSQGTGENWTLVSSGALTLPADRKTAGSLVAVSNSTSYKSYKVVFPTIKAINGDGTPNTDNLMQIAGIEFFDASAPPSADVDGSGIVDGKDFLIIQRTNTSLIPLWKAQFGGPPPTVGAVVASVPEPTSILLTIAAAGGLAAAGRRRLK
ncbi:PEP-CTERM sorting domain-containing protein [Lacipirellula sp.]|uniref:PEP-CTERM sorting domain-containing protein n=1 Tax=Lacipirellula sp. TaxID=2691419 RepID=UPI003D133393